MPEKLDCIVVGAGVIGIAIARRLALAGREVVVLEAEPDVALHTSSRHSEVIHAGIYYPENSLKAKLCIAGRELLYRYCEDRQVPVEKTGKMIVAAGSAEAAALERIADQAKLNGVDDLRRLSRKEASDLEPAVDCEAALLSPSTGIIDSHSYLLALQGELEAANGSIICRSSVGGIRVLDDGFEVEVGSEDSYSVRCNYLVNAAGLWAQDVARNIDGLPEACIPERYLCKAHYFAYAGQSPFRRLIYPVPGGGGLGIHVTLDMTGSVRFGPDSVWVKEIDYGFDEDRKQDFAAAIRRYYPALDDEKLTPGFTGIRPKLAGPGEAAADFSIQSFEDHGVRGLVNLYGIESPGLTASLAIARLVERKLILGG
ncbi:MAG: NAD(P)/FAD-dependent oxidoreductase [Woeseia sp.]